MTNQQNVSPDALLALVRGRRSVRRSRADPAPDEMIEQLRQKR
jgi:hypothetical protein